MRKIFVNDVQPETKREMKCFETVVVWRYLQNSQLTKFPFSNFLNIATRQRDVLKQIKMMNFVSLVFLGQNEFRTLCHPSVIQHCIVNKKKLQISTHFSTFHIQRFLKTVFVNSHSSCSQSKHRIESSTHPINVQHLSHQVKISINLKVQYSH